MDSDFIDTFLSAIVPQADKTIVKIEINNFFKNDLYAFFNNIYNVKKFCTIVSDYLNSIVTMH
ncbi:hypothetical protein VYA_12670 [Vibrio alfacsensis]|nr:hypothetical protein VYA_12670 [Vibrio alfacsensis]